MHVKWDLIMIMTKIVGNVRYDSTVCTPIILNTCIYSQSEKSIKELNKTVCIDMSFLNSLFFFF